ncbi:MAG: flavodoxin domain-containing protein [Myxococcaceae bacterium]
MRVLITWGSKRGGTEGIARMVGEALRSQGVEVDVLAPREARAATGFDAAIIGGALYANRWHARARQFVRERQTDLRKVPVWFFSSGPLDDSATRAAIPPTRQVEILMERVGAQGHITFGGRLAPDAATALAKTHSGDWRDSEKIRAWALTVAEALPTARPAPAVEQDGASWTALLLHAALGWGLCALVMAALLALLRPPAALALHALSIPLIFIPVAVHYFRQRGAREPLEAALAFTGATFLLDLVAVAGIVENSLAIFTSLLGVWLPLVLVFLVTLATGEVLSTLPWHRPQEARGTPAGPWGAGGAAPGGAHP